MAFNTFVSIDQDKINRLPFVKGGYRYYFEDSVSDPFLGVVYEVTREDYSKAWKRLLGQSSDEIKSGDKVYIMPGSKIPLFKLKDHCKKIGASVIGDLDKATFFIGTARIIEKNTREHDWQARSSSLMFSDSSPLLVSEDITEWIDYLSSATITPTAAYQSISNHLDKYPGVLVSGKFVRKKSIETYAMEQGQMYFLTPVAVNLIYTSIAKKIPIVSEETILNQISPAVVIDEYTYESIESMLASDDTESNEVGAEILANCNIEKSMFYLWKLAVKHGGVVSSVHSKNMRLFMERTKWSAIRNMDPEQFIEHLYEKKLLTKDYFQVLIEEASKEYNNSLNNSVFKMVLTPSDTYKEYAEPENVFKFVHSADILVDEDEEVEEEVPF